MPSPPAASSPSPRSRWGTALSLVVLATVGLALATRVFPDLQTRLISPTRAAQWIWEERDRRDVAPTAFYAVRDFDLETLPARARLLVAADEEYVLYLNGRRVGAGSWEEDAPLDVYEVGPLLQPGSNRLLAELRSGRGTGGFLLSLDDGAGRQLAWSDDEWRLFHRHHPGLVRGWLPLERKPEDPPRIPESEPAVQWGRPPVGRWGLPRVNGPQPLFFDIASGQPTPASAAAPPGRKEGAPELFDWGKPVAGYLTIDVAPATELQVGLLFTGDTPPDPRTDRPAGPVLVMPGKREWMAARPGRFRYALVVGLGNPLGAGVRTVDPAVLPGLLPAARSGEGSGVFGLTPPPLRTPVEDKVGREF